MTEYTADRSTRSVAQRVSGYLRSGVSYVLFAVGVAFLASFFVPYLGFEALAWHTAVLPTVAAPTPNDYRPVVDVGPLLAGTVLASVGVWLR